VVINEHIVEALHFIIINNMGRSLVIKEAAVVSLLWETTLIDFMAVLIRLVDLLYLVLAHPETLRHLLRCYWLDRHMYI
jgi:hypothetical protein